MSLNFDEVTRITAEDLPQLVTAIDRDHLYPADILARYGRAGVYAAHLGAGAVDLGPTYRAIETVSEECLSTGFCVWCQTAVGWVIARSGNAAARDTILGDIALGKVMAGPGLSNCMKAMAGIDRMRLTGVRVEGGWQVTGALPWVSNLSDGGVLVMAFDTQGDTPRRLCAVLRATAPEVTLRPNDDYLSMGGTATVTVQMRAAFVPDDQILADPMGPFVAAFRPGFLLMQSALATGAVRRGVRLMEQTKDSLGDINRYLEVQPEDIAAELAPLAAEAEALCTMAATRDEDVSRRVLMLRLKAGELAMRAAHWAMLHSGARGFSAAGGAQRLLREAYFLGIVTPSTKQLRKMLA